jgi:hypothetical protein
MTTQEVISQRDILNAYVEDGRLSRKTTTRNGVDYEIYCYTKLAFFAFNWDEILISHRGKVYRSDTFQPINNPIPKIFNIGEQPESSMERLEQLLEEEPYEILDKVNGHLVIVSPDASTQFKNVLVSTKGSFEGFVEKDEDLLHRMGVLRQIKHHSLNYTLMFECLAEYDKHLWYEEQKARYGGEDTMVLLAGVDNNTGEECTYDQLLTISWIIGSRLATKYPHLEGTDVNKWFEHKGIEGYVVHFPAIGQRIKVKTKEYTTLRYLKEISSEKLVNFLYNSQMFNMYLEFDEEMYPILEALKEDMRNFLFFEVTRAPRPDSMTDKAAIAANKDLNAIQKAYFLGDKSESYMEGMMDRKGFRKAFKEFGIYPETEKAIKKMFGEVKALLDGSIQA